MDQLIAPVHSEWQEAVKRALKRVDPFYLALLQSSPTWIPRPQHLLAAFSLPLTATKYILLGESPYPRVESANGYAFWDNAVGTLWSEKGFSKSVNRATSLRNLLKMFLVARGSLRENCSQEAISKLDKSMFIQTATGLFARLMSSGFLLLNASLVYSDGQVQYHARHWLPFIQSIFQWLAHEKPSVELVLLGKIAAKVPKTGLSIGLQAEHPYNLSFITNPQVIQFFKPMDILKHYE